MACGTIIVNEGNSPTFNLGDYIQALAAMQYLPPNCENILIERDNLTWARCNNKPVKVIMNGWWMDNPSNFPPDNSIIPLYRSFHLRPRIEKSFFSEKTIAHLEKNQPIGCRDTNTVKMMLAHGVKAYFSGCLTLTLGLTFKHFPQETSPIYIVDPYVGKMLSKDVCFSLFRLIRCIFSIIYNWKLINDIHNRIKETCPYSRHGYDLWLYSTKICAIYSSSIGEDVLKKAIYRTHAIPGHLYKSHKDRIDLARQFLDDYSKAQFVLTSRIHCGLPCLGIGTPVILAVSPAMIKSGRMGGIKDLFKTATFRRGKCVLERKDFDNIHINSKYHFGNYDKHIKYVNELMNDCKMFFMNKHN